METMTPAEIAETTQLRTVEAVDEICELWWMRSEVPCADSKREALRAIVMRHVLGIGVPSGSVRF